MAELFSHNRISEQILEIRYTPNPSFLDYRGTFAQAIAELLNLENWQINENRIDIFNNEKITRAFVSYKNLGLIIHNSPEKGYFSDQATKFVKYVFSQKPFEVPIHILRIGVRSRFAEEVDMEFSELVELFSKKYCGPTEEVKGIFSGNLVDVGAPLNFELENGAINSHTGPMGQSQVKGFFPLLKVIPEIAIYTELDYWKIFDKPLKVEEVTRALKYYSVESWDIQEKIFRLIAD